MKATTAGIPTRSKREELNKLFFMKTKLRFKRPLALLLVLGTFIAVQSLFAAETNSTPERIGIYDSRVVAYAEFWSEAHQRKLNDLVKSAKEAKAAGDTNRFNELETERLSRICFIDYDREMALVVERLNPQSGRNEIIAVGRLSKAHGTNESEFALIVSDVWQKHGLGTELLRLLVAVARDERLNRLTATMLADNGAMQHIARTVGFRVQQESGTHEYFAELDLKPAHNTTDDRSSSWHT
jgi:RimJ/RimL family protein N-acetyltransferase